MLQTPRAVSWGRNPEPPSAVGTLVLRQACEYRPVQSCGISETEGKDSRWCWYRLSTPGSRTTAIVAAALLLGVTFVGGFLIAGASSIVEQHWRSHTWPPSLRISAEHRSVAAKAHSVAPDHGCCSADTAACGACAANSSVVDFCAPRSRWGLPGCDGFCGLNEDSYKYPGGDIATAIQPSPQACCAACRREARCTSWTWAKTGSGTDSGMCYLKSQKQLQRVPDEGYISGLPGSDVVRFRIRDRSGGCLDAGGVRRGRGELQLCTSRRASWQTWRYERTTGQIRALQARGGKCLEAIRAGHLHLKPCDIASAGQRWVFDSVSSRVENVFGLCWLGSGEGTFRQVRARPCHEGDTAQEWSFWAAGADWAAAWAENATSTSTSTVTRTTTTATSTSTRTSTSTTMSTRPPLDTSMFCWALCLPWSYEPDLLKMQHLEQRGIFACETFTVYSSEAVDLGRGYKTAIVDADLHCPLGGIYHTALNTPIFQKIWARAVQDGHFRLHPWTVKADPDTVFLPQRLKDVVSVKGIAGFADAGTGVFLNDCRFGLHGPLEVVSRQAMETFAANGARCATPPQEDVFLQACLLSLGVLQVNQWNLLAEFACKTPGWETCQTAHTSFHPFKGLDQYKKCQAAAERSPAWRSTSLHVAVLTVEEAAIAEGADVPAVPPEPAPDPPETEEAPWVVPWGQGQDVAPHGGNQAAALPAIGAAVPKEATQVVGFAAAPPPAEAPVF